jgi:hypothetical protein
MAAQQVQMEYAAIVAEAWPLFWEIDERQPLPIDWTFRPPHDPGDEISLIPSKIFADRCFTRRFERGRFVADLFVALGYPGLAEDQLRFGFGLWDEDEAILDDCSLEGWTLDEHDCLWGPGVAIELHVDLASCQIKAKQAVEFIIQNTPLDR